MAEDCKIREAYYQQKIVAMKALSQAITLAGERIEIGLKKLCRCIDEKSVNLQNNLDEFAVFAHILKDVMSDVLKKVN